MSWIISANYRDRSSKYRWLVRTSDQRPDQAIAVQSVRAHDVRFIRSSQFEAGFGCHTVAEASDCSWEGQEPPLEIKLRFAADKFVDESGNVHTEVERLELHEDGRVVAVPVAS